MDEIPVKKTKHSRLVQRARLGRIALLSLVLAACSSATPSQQTAVSNPPEQSAGAVQPAEVDRQPKVAPTTDGAAQTATTAQIQDDSADLAALWASRSMPQGSNPAEFPLGPGDLVRISVPQIPQLRDRSVRVSEENLIALPLIGEINVAGMSEEDLRNEVSHRISKYMYHPQVEVFLEHTESRQVAVIGSVKVPGRYTLASRADTIMTMISHAGGLADEASTRIILIPAGNVKAPARPTGSAAPDMRLAAADPAQMSSTSPGAASADAVALQMMTHRVVLSTTRAADQRYLELPAMPGDVIIVPAAGEVTVQGWVDKGGAFKITPGMTATGAIAAAGGANFSGSATLLREQEDGRKLQIPLNLSEIKSGRQPDVQVQSGDVVVVERSALGAVPYTVYFLAQHIGMGLGFSAM
jgi:polysaccharide biosynthesis/export protein